MLMLKNYIKTFAFTALTAFCAGYSTNASAQTVTYGAYSGDEQLQDNGTGKNETYDVAILIKDDALVGKKVKGVKIPMATSNVSLVTDTKAFMTTKLSVSSNTNVADLETKDFDFASGTTDVSFDRSITWVEVDFDTPYTLTADGVYVGYSFTTTQDGLYPLLSVTGKDEAFMNIHSTKTYRKWKQKAEAFGTVLAMQALVDGVEANGATAVLEDVNGQINTPLDYTFKLKNTSSSTINDVDFTYTLAGKTETLHKKLSTPLTPHFGKTTDVAFTLPSLPDAGSFALSVTVDKVNGNANTFSAPTGTAKYQVYNLLPVKRALVEEYTGTWCGWCPRGFVGLEHMNELLGNDFVCVSYHNGDAMTFTSSYPNTVDGFPSAWLDRSRSTDAYCGDNYDGHFHLDETYAEANKELAPADVDAQAYFTDANQNEIEVQSTTTFAVDNDANPYQLSYLLTAGGLSGTGSSWEQSNYFCTYASSYPDDDMKQFTQGESKVKDLVFNFVLVGWNGKSYLPNSLPTNVPMLEPLSHTYTFDLSSSTDLVDASIIQDKSKLDVIVLLLDSRTGVVANARKVHVYDSKDAAAAAGISNVTSSKDERIVGYYSVDGRRFSQAQPGLNIVRLANGKSFKVFKR